MDLENAMRKNCRSSLYFYGILVAMVQANTNNQSEFSTTVIVDEEIEDIVARLVNKVVVVNLL